MKKKKIVLLIVCLALALPSAFLLAEKGGLAEEGSFFDRIFGKKETPQKEEGRGVLKGGPTEMTTGTVSAAYDLIDVLLSMKTQECRDAYRSYTRIRAEYNEKREICDQVDEASAQEEQEFAIYMRLADMYWDCSRADDCNCSDLINSYRDAARAASDRAHEAAWSYWHQCSFEGRSLSSLQTALASATEIVCEQCDYTWPVESSDDRLLDVCEGYRRIR